MYPILTPEEMNRKLQVSYPVFLKTWYEHAIDDGDCSLISECRKEDKLYRGDHSYFDSQLRSTMRSDFTAYINRCNYQFSTKDKNAEKKTIAMIRAEFDKFEQEWKIESANRQAEREREKEISF